jgi:hypothetical protein
MKTATIEYARTELQAQKKVAKSRWQRICPVLLRKSGHQMVVLAVALLRRQRKAESFHTNQASRVQ